MCLRRSLNQEEVCLVCQLGQSGQTHVRFLATTILRVCPGLLFLLALSATLVLLVPPWPLATQESWLSGDRGGLSPMLGWPLPWGDGGGPGQRGPVAFAGVDSGTPPANNGLAAGAVPAAAGNGSAGFEVGGGAGEVSADAVGVGAPGCAAVRASCLAAASACCM